MELIGSICTYLFVFAVAIGLFWLSDGGNRGIYYKTGSCGTGITVGIHRLSFIYAILGIVLISLFAGLRATTVGADTQGYPVRFTAVASYYDNFFDFLNDPGVAIGDEPLGALVAWFCSRMNLGIAPLLFSYQFLTIGPVYLAAKKFEGKLSIPLAMAVYLLFFFNNSLNMMRQSVACALLLFALSVYIADRKIKPISIVAVVTAYYFHRSALYGIVLLILPSLIMRVNRKGLQYLFYILLIAAPLALTQVSQFLINSGIADAHMRYYLDVFVAGGGNQEWNINPLGRYSLAYLLMYSSLVSVPYIFTSPFFELRNIDLGNKNRDSIDMELLSVVRRLNITGFLIYVVLLFSLKTMYGIRFSIFLDFFLIISIPLSCGGERSLQKKLLLCMLLLSIWYVWIFCVGWSASSIYKLSF